MTVNSNYSSYASYGSSSTSSVDQKTKPDFAQIAQELLGSMDGDSSGGVDLSEFTTAMGSSSSSDMSALASDIFSKIDSDGSGSMSSEEFMSALEASKPQKQHSMQGMGSMPPPPPPEESSESSSATADEIFSALDTDQDGTISQSELLALLENSSKETNTTKSSDSTASLKDKMLQNLLSYYSSNAQSLSDSSLSISA